ncbi:Hypothetical predicted protein [Octopus vulgaris]|uniref:Uncharacterized protein n=1 Tax=Octopus vulgaris TaxID=6645 RepID=A0AA36BLI5_OCTVU|nr:Hypothetical predicted protein [Octopus vulgaris]
MGEVRGISNVVTDLPHEPFAHLSDFRLLKIFQWPECMFRSLDPHNVVDGSLSDGDNLRYLNYYKRATHLNELLNTFHSFSQ